MCVYVKLYVCTGVCLIACACVCLCVFLCVYVCGVFWCVVSVRERERASVFACVYPLIYAYVSACVCM